MHVFYTPDIQTRAELPEEEAAHAVRVLRLQEGDEVMLTDGAGNFYRAAISAASNKRCLVQVLETLPQEPLWTGHLHLAMAPTKNMDRTEWLAEKATEIGFDELTFLNCRFSERRVIKTERIQKILVSAVKQSLKARLPRLNEMTDFHHFVKQPFKGQKFIVPLLRGREAAAEGRAEAGRGRAGTHRARRRLQRRGSATGLRAGLPPRQPGALAPPHGDGCPRGLPPDEPLQPD